jgi:hypothetical protein
VLTSIEWQSSKAADDRRSGNAFFDVRIYPPLLAPCDLDLLAGLTLLEAFRQLVLGDAEVATLGRKAAQLSPDFAAAFVSGRCEIHGFEEWPLAFNRWVMVSTVHPDPAKRSKYDVPRRPDPIEVAATIAHHTTSDPREEPGALAADGDRSSARARPAPAPV